MLIHELILISLFFEVYSITDTCFYKTCVSDTKTYYRKINKKVSEKT